MKKIFAIALAVVMVLSIASVAGAAFNWGPGTTNSAETFASRYQIDVVKLVNETGIIGSNRVLEDDNATAVNNAPVYFYIRLTVSGASDTPDAIQDHVEACVEFTSLENWNGTALTNEGYVDCTGLPNGTYYYVINPTGEGENGRWRYQPLTNDINNSDLANAVIEARCLDTETAKVTATVRSRRPLVGDAIYEVGDFKFEVENNVVRFYDADGKHLVSFIRNGDGLVTGRQYPQNVNSEDVMELYAWLNDGNANTFMAALDNKDIYMSNDNLWAAFGFSYSQSDSATWKANSTPIILDPTVSIPKTGDNASVIGFAMIMVAVVAAAVAVRKVNA